MSASARSQFLPAFCCLPLLRWRPICRRLWRWGRWWALFVKIWRSVSGSFIRLVNACLCWRLRCFRRWRRGWRGSFGMENVLVGSIVLLVAGMILRSLLPSAALLLAGTVVIGAAIAMGNVLLPALAKRSLPTRVGLVVGAVSGHDVGVVYGGRSGRSCRRWRNGKLALVVGI